MSSEHDEAAIVAHIRGLFDAYINHDREAIRAGHTPDWVGFSMRQPTILRGIDEYMRVAEVVLENLPAYRYEFLDIETQLHGDLALVWYTARDFLRDPDGGTRTALIRSLDVYRRDGSGWNQSGSHIVAFPEDPR